MAGKLIKAQPKEDLVVKEDEKMPELTEEQAKEVFPGGPTRYQVDLWKADLEKRGLPSDLVVQAIGGEKVPFIFRKLVRPEYIDILNKTREDENDDYRDDVRDVCILWPENWNQKQKSADTKGLAGTPTTIFESIMDHSGFNVLNTWTL
jgi:hypothetical protein